ncbi:hypothetical protein N2152v2_008004 [Parachlorella kessleri]
MGFSSTLLSAACCFSLLQLGLCQWREGTLAQQGYGSAAAPGPGACGYGVLPATIWPFGNTAALDPATSPFALAGSNMSGCGLCLEVDCTEAAGCAPNTQTVLVTDWCEGCGPDVIYVAGPAFRSLVTDSVGEVAGRFRRVPCDPPSGITVHVDNYRATQGGWIRLGLVGVAGTGDITSVDIKGSSQADSSWKPMQRTYGAAWEASGLPPAPLDLRITSAGQQLVAKSAIQQAGVSGNFPTNVQFKATGPTVPAPAKVANISRAAPAAEVSASPPALVPLIASPAVMPSPAPIVSPSPSPPLAASPQPANTSSPAANQAAPRVSNVVVAASPIATASPAPAVSLPPAPAPTLELLTPQAALAVPPPVGVLAPQPSPQPSPQQPSPQPAASPSPSPTAEGSPAPPPVNPCLQRLASEEPLGLQQVQQDFVPEEGLPTLPDLPNSAGPATPGDVAAAGHITTSNCSTALELLEAIPDAADWLNLMKHVGLESLLNDPNSRNTLLVPTGLALNASINACPLRNESTLPELLLNAPELVNPLVGYHVLRGLWPTYTMVPGVMINSSDTIDKVNFLQIQAGSSHQLRGIGSTSNILQGNIVACGPTIIHILDTVLLPFTFNQGAIDAISGTQPKPAAEKTEVVGPPQGGRRLLRQG